MDFRKIAEEIVDYFRSREVRIVLLAIVCGTVALTVLITVIAVSAGRHNAVSNVPPVNKSVEMHLNDPYIELDWKTDVEGNGAFDIAPPMSREDFIKAFPYRELDQKPDYYLPDNILKEKVLEFFQ